MSTAEQEAEKAKSRKQRFFDWTESTTCHGVRDVAIARHSIPWFIFWFVLFAGTTGACGWQLYTLISGYIAGPAYGTAVSYESLDELPFPAVTVCNYNRAEDKKMKQIGIDQNALIPLFGSFFNSQLFPANIWQTPGSHGKGNDYNKTFLPAWRKFIKKNPQYTNKSNDLLAQLATPCHYMVEMCMFADVPIENCCSSKYMKQIYNTYGVCQSLYFPASDGSKNQKFPGPSHGMRLLADANMGQYPSGPFYNNYLDSGLIILVNFNPSHPFPVDPIHAAPGTHVLISMTLVETRFNAPQYTVFPWPCKTDAKLEILEGQYTPDMCFYDCYVYWTAQLCGCKIVSMSTSKHAKYPTCMPEDTPCVNQLMGVISNWPYQMGKPPKHYNETAARFLQCTKSCAPGCKPTYSIVSTVTTTAMPSSALAVGLNDMINKAFKDKAGNDSMYNWDTLRGIAQSNIVDIYYPSLLKQVVETQELTPIFNFIGNLGGQLGIWMGASVLTLVQALIAWTRCLCVAPQLNRRKPRNTKVNSSAVDVTMPPKPAIAS